MFISGFRENTNLFLFFEVYKPNWARLVPLCVVGRVFHRFHRLYCKYVSRNQFLVLIGWLRTYYLVGSLGFGCEVWTDQSGLVSPMRLTSAFLLAASIAARSSLNDWIMSKNPSSFRTSSRHLLLSHINWPKEAHFETIVSNYKFLAQII